MRNQQSTQAVAGLTNEQIDDAWDSLPATSLRGQGENEWNRENRRAFARVIEREVAAQAGKVAPAEEMARFCPACGLVGDVESGYRDCCPDGNEARRIPKSLAEKCRELFKAALHSGAAAGQVAVPEWISVDERLPDGGYCLATYRDRAGKLRIIRAKYVRQYEVEASGEECDGQSTEYNEADDTEYLKAGWLECIDNWGEYSSVYVCEGEVTHWRPLPPLPSAQASTPDGPQEGGAA